MSLFLSQIHKARGRAQLGDIRVLLVGWKIPGIFTKRRAGVGRQRFFIGFPAVPTGAMDRPESFFLKKTQTEFRPVISSGIGRRGRGSSAGIDPRSEWAVRSCELGLPGGGAGETRVRGAPTPSIAR